MCTLLLQYETNDGLKSLYRTYQIHRMQAERTGHRPSINFWTAKAEKVEKEAANRGFDLNN